MSINTTGSLSGTSWRDAFRIGRTNLQAGSLATAALDTNNDGKIDTLITGVDRNLNGIPDALEGRTVSGYSTYIDDASALSRSQFVNTTTTSPVISPPMSPSRHHSMTEYIITEGGLRIPHHDELMLTRLPIAERREHARLLYHHFQHRGITAPPEVDADLNQWILLVQSDGRVRRIRSRESSPGRHHGVTEYIITEGGLRIPHHDELMLGRLSIVERREHARLLYHHFRHRGLSAPPEIDADLIEWILQAQSDGRLRLSPRSVSCIGGIASLPVQEVRTVIREVPQEVFVDKEVIVPRIDVREVMVEVPQTLEIDRILEVEKPELVDIRREVLNEQHRIVDRAVPRTLLQPFERIESVPITLKQEFIQEVPQTLTLDCIKETPQITEEVRVKEIIKPVHKVSVRNEPIPAVTKKQQLMEVPMVDNIVLQKEVPLSTIEQVERVVPRPVCEIEHLSEVVDMVQTVERVYETPEKIIVEYVIEEPKIVYEIVEKKVSKPVIEYVEKIVHVPHYVTVEEIVEVPVVEKINIVKEIPVPVVKYVDRPVSNHEMRYSTKIEDYGLRLREEVIVEVPETQLVDIAVEAPLVRVTEKEIAFPNYSIRESEILDEVCLQTKCERPVPVPEKMLVDVVTQVPNVIKEAREKLIAKDLYAPVAAIETIEMEVTEEFAELVPGVQNVELRQEELHQIVEREVKAIPRVSMDYVEHRVEVDWNLEEKRDHRVIHTMR